MTFPARVGRAWRALHPDQRLAAVAAIARAAVDVPAVVRGHHELRGQGAATESVTRSASASTRSSRRRSSSSRWRCSSVLFARGERRALPPAGRRRRRDPGRRAVGHVPALLPPARQARHRAVGRRGRDGRGSPGASSSRSSCGAALAYAGWRIRRARAAGAAATRRREPPPGAGRGRPLRAAHAAGPAREPPRHVEGQLSFVEPPPGGRGAGESNPPPRRSPALRERRSDRGRARVLLAALCDRRLAAKGHERRRQEPAVARKIRRGRGRRSAGCADVARDRDQDPERHEDQHRRGRRGCPRRGRRRPHGPLPIIRGPLTVAPAPGSSPSIPPPWRPACGASAICRARPPRWSYLATQARQADPRRGPGRRGQDRAGQGARPYLDRLVRLQCYEGLDEAKALYEWNYRKQLLRIQAEATRAGRLGCGPGRHLRRGVPARAPADDRDQRSAEPVVLLIDEIDKTDQEFEAMLLELLSDFQISIPELGRIEARTHPVVLLTSNNTRELTEALKRRCLYLWLDYPRPSTSWRSSGCSAGAAETIAQRLVEVVAMVRELDLKKPPSIAESIDWARALLLLGADDISPEVFPATMSIIVKHRTDLDVVAERVGVKLGAAASCPRRVPGSRRASSSSPRSCATRASAVGTSELLDAFAAWARSRGREPSRFREALAATLAKSPEDRRVFELVFERFFFRAAEAEALRACVKGAPPAARAAGRHRGEQIDYDNLREQVAAGDPRRRRVRDARPRSARDRGVRPARRGLGRARRRRPADPARARPALGARRPGRDRAPPSRRPRATRSAASSSTCGASSSARRSSARSRCRRRGRSTSSTGAAHRPAAGPRGRAPRRRAAQAPARHPGPRDARAQAPRARRRAPTMRASLQTGGVPGRAQVPPAAPEAAELYVLCDVSTSVTRASVFFLSVLHALHDAFRKMRSFVFVERIEVTDVFERERSSGPCRRRYARRGRRRRQGLHRLRPRVARVPRAGRRRPAPARDGDRARRRAHQRARPARRRLRRDRRARRPHVLAQPRAAPVLELRRLGDRRLRAVLRGARVLDHPRQLEDFEGARRGRTRDRGAVAGWSGHGGRAGDHRRRAVHDPRHAGADGTPWASPVWSRRRPPAAVGPRRRPATRATVARPQVAIGSSTRRSAPATCGRSMAEGGPRELDAAMRAFSERSVAQGQAAWTAEPCAGGCGLYRAVVLRALGARRGAAARAGHPVELARAVGLERLVQPLELLLARADHAKASSPACSLTASETSTAPGGRGW